MVTSSVLFGASNILKFLETLEFNVKTLKVVSHFFQKRIFDDV